MRCAVSGCNNSNQGGSATTSICYHTFPKDSAVLKQWLLFCGRNGKINPNTARICSIHFAEEDYQVDTLLASYGIKRKLRKLHNGVVPTQHLPRQQREGKSSVRLDRLGRQKNKTTKEIESPEFFLMNSLEANNESEIHLSNQRLQKQQQQEEEAERALHDLQEQETSGPSFNIKEEISIDESVLEEYLIPKLEPLENTSTDTTDGVDPLSLSYVQNQTSQETVSRCSSKTSTAVSPNIAEKNESANFMNIIPKLETFENTSVEENFIFSSPVQETTILRSTLKDNTNFSSTSSNASQSKKRKLSDEDGRVEDHDFPSVVQVKSENKEDYVDYAMYIADRLKNSNQSDSAIAMAKEKMNLFYVI